MDKRAVQHWGHASKVLLSVSRHDSLKIGRCAEHHDEHNRTCEHHVSLRLADVHAFSNLSDKSSRGPTSQQTSRQNQRPAQGEQNGRHCIELIHGAVAGKPTLLFSFLADK